MQKRLAFLAAAMLCMFNAPAARAADEGFTISVCGTLTTPYTPGRPNSITVDVNGQLCTSGSGGGGGGSVTQGTSPWVDNITQWGSVALGAPSNYGTSPGAVMVPGVNSFVTNFPATQPISAASLPLPSGAATEATLQSINTNIQAPIPAGTAIIGKVGIDQTTPGTTNAVVFTNTTLAVTNAGTFAVQPASATAPVSTMNSASANSGVNSAMAGVFDDVTPTAITENSFGFLRMSANRNAYYTLRDAAGNERGQNIDANNNAGVVLPAETTKVLGTVRIQGNVGGVLDAAIGAAPPANSQQLAALGGGATGGFLARVISCDSHIFKHITTATDTLAVQGVASQTIYICAWRSRAAGTATWYLENTNNTNANCGGTLTQITGLASEVVNSGEVFAPGYWNGLKNTSGNGLCINSTGTGGVDIDIWYAQF